jgi:hypothetical protein
MKTALQELIEIIEKTRAKNGFCNSTLKNIHLEALILLEKEKEDILYVYNKGCEDGHNGFAEKSFEDIIQ